MKVMPQPILIVEDDPDGQAVVAHIASYLKIPHQVVGDAEKAIVKLFGSGETSAETYGAVIIDLALPGKDGWELLADIRGNPATSDVVCIAVTAFHTSKMREDALLAGF